MFDQVFGNEDIANKTIEYPSEKFQDCSKIMFEFHNNLILSIREKKLCMRVEPDVLIAYATDFENLYVLCLID